MGRMEGLELTMDDGYYSPRILSGMILPETTLPEANSKFAPENGWLEGRSESFLLGFDLKIQGANLLLHSGSLR